METYSCANFFAGALALRKLPQQPQAVRTCANNVLPRNATIKCHQPTALINGERQQIRNGYARVREHCAVHQARRHRAAAEGVEQIRRLAWPADGEPIGQRIASETWQALLRMTVHAVPDIRGSVREAL